MSSGLQKRELAVFITHESFKINRGGNEMVKELLKEIIIIINSFYRAQITFKSLSAFRTRIDRHMYKNTQKHEEEKYQTEKHIIKYHSLHNNGNYFTNK